MTFKTQIPDAYTALDTNNHLWW